MKKIGILTYWGVPNYGAWIQAYALNKILTQMCPKCDVKHIAYLEQSHWNSYYKNDIKGLNNFAYNWDEIPHTPQLSREELEKEPWDVLITGADSIWEEILTGVIEHDWHLIGKDLNNCKKIISYAPSSGIYEGYDHIPSQVLEGLRNYDLISVRDKTTQKFVENAIGEQVPIVLDPALLWDFSSDNAVKNPQFNKYIAVYGADWNQGFINNVVEYARGRNCLLISIGFINEWCDINFRRNELRSLEWIGMIAHSECVVTSTFHGLMMGLNYKKNIKFCKVDYVRNRSQTLIDLCRLPDHNQNFASDLDYRYINKQLAEAKKNSLIWLKNAIDIY